MEDVDCRKSAIAGSSVSNPPALQLFDHDEAVAGNNIGDDATVRRQQDKGTVGERSSRKRAPAQLSERRKGLIKRTWRVSHPTKDPTLDGMDDFATRFEAEEHAEMLCELIKLRPDVYGPDDWHRVFISEIH